MRDAGTKKKKNPSWGESITLYKFDDENEPDAQQQHTAAQMGIYYIDILCSNITLSISLSFFLRQKVQYIPGGRER